MIRKPDVLKKKLHLMKTKVASLIGISDGMRVVDVGSGQGTFAAAIARLTGENGEVVAVDVTDEYLPVMKRNLNEYGVADLVEFVKADATKMYRRLPLQSFDAAVSYRLIEELTDQKKLPRIIMEMAKLVRPDGTVAFVELSTETHNVAEENLIRLHRDIGGDYFPKAEEVLQHMKNAGLMNTHVITVETNVWFSGELFLEGAGGQDEIWTEFKDRIMKELWPSVKEHGMKYPSFNVFIGQKPKNE
jgi:ubiquinone/menaquinone biosynthesis C-methylase UbiE